MVSIRHLLSHIKQPDSRPRGTGLPPGSGLDPESETYPGQAPEFFVFRICQFFLFFPFSPLT